MRLFLFAALPALLAAAAPAGASTLFSENFDAVRTDNYGVGQHVGGFSVNIGDVDVFGTPGTNYACPSPNSAPGNHCLDLNGNNNGSIASNGLSVTAGQTYTVSFKMAGNGEPDFPSYTSPYTFDVSFAGTRRSFSVVPLATFQDVSFDLVADSTRLSSLIFASTSDNRPTYWGAVLDDVRVTAPDPAAVPEPATWAAMGLGFGVLGAAARRRPARHAALA